MALWLAAAPCIGGANASEGAPDPPTAEAKPASEHTRALAERVRQTLPFDDRQDFELAARGLVATLTEPFVRDANGQIVRDLSGWDLFAGEAPDTVNPSLWRLSQLHSRAGLYKVTDSIYQVRGLDLANMTLVVGERGFIVIDPLMSTETAAAALALVRRHLGDRPVTAVIYTHSHTDHYGGVKGVVSEEEVAKGRVPIIAPEGFLREVVSENIIAGPAQSRRVTYMFGSHLPYGASGAVNYGLGPAYRTGFGGGTIALIPPTREITRTGETLTLDGVEFEFQLTPDSEAPAEMMFYLPRFRALCAAELANGTLHNVLTLRGALVRDARKWAEYLSEAVRRYGARTDVVFASHFWPRWGGQTVTDYLESHRDAYKFLHDQSVRLMNQGLTAAEIAEAITLPDAIARPWFNRPYYGTLSHNAKAIYQRYLGWYDGNPANLQPVPPETAATRYVEALGGARAAMERARKASAEGEYRWAAELLKHVVFADPANRDAQLYLADSLEQLGYQAESAAWRNAYLTGAFELRHGIPEIRFTTAGTSLGSLPLEVMLDMAAVRLDPAVAAGRELRIGFTETKTAVRRLAVVRNGVLVHSIDADGAAAVELRGTAAAYARLFGGRELEPLLASGELEASGEVEVAKKFLDAIPPPPRDFNIVTP